jgi:hypothetical protein
MPPFLSRMDVCDVELDKGDRYSQERVSDGDRVMGPAPGIQNNPIGPIGASLLDTVDDCPFPIAATLSNASDFAHLWKNSMFAPASFACCRPAFSTSCRVSEP